MTFGRWLSRVALFGNLPRGIVRGLPEPPLVASCPPCDSASRAQSTQRNTLGTGSLRYTRTRLGTHTHTKLRHFELGGHLPVYPVDLLACWRAVQGTRSAG